MAQSLVGSDNSHLGAYEYETLLTCLGSNTGSCGSSNTEFQPQLYKSATSTECGMKLASALYENRWPIQLELAVPLPRHYSHET